MSEQDTDPMKDPMVDIVSRLEEIAGYRVAPGLLVFLIDMPDTSVITVTRSRFDGEYGSICRMMRSRQGSVMGRTYAPTVSVMAVLQGVNVAADMERLFKEWMEKGK